MERRLVLRRLLLIGTPLVLALLMIVHQLIDQFERPDAFLVLHLILLPLFALMGVAVWALLEGVSGAVAWSARVAAFVFLVGYVALDAISGIAASAILASGAPWSKEATQALFTSGPAALPTVLAVLAWRVSVLLVAWALFRAGRPLAPLVLLVATTVWLNNDHGGCGGSSSSVASRWPQRGWNSFLAGFASAARGRRPSSSPSPYSLRDLPRIPYTRSSSVKDR